MSAGLDLAKTALDDAFSEGMKRMFSVYVEGLENPDIKPVDVAARFRRGLSYHCDAYNKISDIMQVYFK